MMKKILIYYNFILVTILVIGGFISSNSIPQLISAIIFFPLFAYLFLLVIPSPKKALKEIIIPENAKEEIVDINSQVTVLPIEETVTKKGLDINRRAFLKIIGSAGVSLFLFTLFTKKTEAAFFGSVPGPGTVAVKNTSGSAIDPAEKYPTDGYKITQVDDSSPAYYGYLDKNGAWFITKEDASGNYRYTKGSSDFPSNWTNRVNLTYDYFDNIF